MTPERSRKPATIHEAVVEEVLSPGLVPHGWYGWRGTWGFRAVCLETGVECDAWGFSAGEQGSGGEGEAADRALEYLSQSHLHGAGSPHFCDAHHVFPSFGRPRAIATSGKAPTKP